MHILTQAVSYSKVRSSSEEIYIIPGKQTAVSPCCAALGVKDDAVKSNGRLKEKYYQLIQLCTAAPRQLQSD